MLSLKNMVIKWGENIDKHYCGLIILYFVTIIIIFNQHTITNIIVDKHLLSIKSFIITFNINKVKRNKN
jgi:hypothetical protein